MNQSTRKTKTKGHIIIHHGTDHALGSFLQLRDTHFEGTSTDHQGEGYIFDYDQRFGISVNLCNLTLKEATLLDPIALEKIDYFIKTLNL